MDQQGGTGGPPPMGQGPAGQAPGGIDRQAQQVADKLPGGVGAFLDFGFKKFLTMGVIKVLYVLSFVVAILILLGYLGTGAVLLVNGSALGLVWVVAGPIAAALYLVFTRITLELVVVIFRIAQDTNTLVQQGGRP